ncbi:ABC transporter permease [Sinomonas sp. JGH33]|uniref:ABC transporter permease n=1 Tax=Sinomonas terricola TaxID=3110330 RepID=A0ABU5T7P5_9MICC|nr:ABC transporter permease [Sinomonas sp. JGH33]MEA5455700.1 ABC transporter permease [Sinomonas sp. JGH33]
MRTASSKAALHTLRFLGGRIGGLLATLLASSFVVFGALYLAPGSPITFLTHGRSMTPEAIAQINEQYHFDEPFIVQYVRWLGGILQGDFGRSILYKDAVGSLLGQRIGTTVALIALSALLVALIGLGIGIFSGLKPGVAASALMGVSTAAMAVPTFVAAVVLTLVFAVELGWFPVFGVGENPIDMLYHLILPAFALALASIAFVARLSQAAIRQEITADHVQTAISRGFPYGVVVRRHVLRNASLPVLTVLGLTLAGMISGTVVVEQVFQLNGLGSLLVSSVQQKDFPVVQAICLVYVTAFIVLNTVIDLAYSVLDPRVSVGGGKS